MICQFCETEYPAEAEHCAECGCGLVESLADAASGLVLEPLGDIYDHQQLEALSRLLEAAGIPYQVNSGTAFAMLERAAMFDTVHASVWEARVAVVSSRFEEARTAWRTACDGGHPESAEPAADADHRDDDRFARIVPR